MIPCTDTCGLKQFVRGKPNPEGLKNFVCATPKGLLDYKVYQGKQTFLDESSKKLGHPLSQSLKKGSHNFMDCYFTTV